MKTKTFILIHGMFINPLCWEKWIPYYQAKGYRVLAPAWPGVAVRANDIGWRVRRRSVTSWLVWVTSPCLRCVRSCKSCSRAAERRPHFGRNPAPARARIHRRMSRTATNDTRWT